MAVILYSPFYWGVRSDDGPPDLGSGLAFLSIQSRRTHPVIGPSAATHGSLSAGRMETCTGSWRRTTAIRGGPRSIPS